MNLFIDTNIILDVISKRKPFYDSSAELLSLLYSEKADGFVSAISFNNIHYIIRKQRGKNIAAKTMLTLLETFEVVSLDKKILMRSATSNFSDFEDAIQFFSAIHCGADYIITRNIKDFPHDDIPVLNPEEFFALDINFD